MADDVQFFLFRALGHNAVLVDNLHALLFSFAFLGDKKDTPGELAFQGCLLSCFRHGSTLIFSFIWPHNAGKSPALLAAPGLGSGARRASHQRAFSNARHLCRVRNYAGHGLRLCLCSYFSTLRAVRQRPADIFNRGALFN